MKHSRGQAVPAASRRRNTIKSVKGDSTMNFILSHWHCILPAIFIVAAAFLMQKKSQDDK
jgi:hypothetical protein